MWGYLAANVGTSKQAGGDRVSTISQPGCSTYMALATSPTDEEEEIFMHMYGQAFFSNPMCYDFYFTFLPVYLTQKGEGQPQKKMC